MLIKSRMHIPRSSNPDADSYTLISESTSNSNPHPNPNPRTGTTFSHSSSSSSFNPFTFKSLTMRNKPRLHLALYAIPKYPHTYHYALLTRAKDIAATTALSGNLPATKHHVKTTIRTNAHGVVSQPWIYETYHIHDLADEPLLLASVVIGKISVSSDRVAELVGQVPVLGDDANEGARGAKFNDVEWVRLAVETLRREGALSDEGLTWEDILKGSLNYMRRKEAEGRFEVGWKGGSVDAVPTFDLLTDKDVLF